MKSKLDLLQQVQKVEVSPFLYTRILQRISNLQEAPASLMWRFAFVTTGILLLLLNISIMLSSKSKTQNNNIETVVSSMNLSTLNELYHE